MRQRRNSAFIAAFVAVFLLVCLCVQGLAEGPAAPNWGEVRVATEPVIVRLKPDLASPTVRTLKAGDRVRLDFPQQNGWTALFDVSEPQRDVTRAIGFAEARLFAPVSQAKPQPQHAAAKPTASGEVKSAVKESPNLQAGKASSTGKDDPVRITSDKMVYSQTENAVVFQGNVHGTQADMAIWAHKVTAYFVKEQKPGAKAGQEKGPGDFGGGDKIDRIVAEGDVRMVSGKNEGACAQLTYLVGEGVLRMEGNPILREGQNTVRGDVIKYYMKENRSEVLSGAQRRVEAIFFSPKGDKK